MTHSYRSPHQKVTPYGREGEAADHFTAEAPPSLPPTRARDADWLMAHVVDVIAAGPLYDGKLSPVWAQMVRLYAQHLGLIGGRAQPCGAMGDAGSDASPASSGHPPENPPENPPAPAAPASSSVDAPSDCGPVEAEAYEMQPIARLDEVGAMREALGFHPRPETLDRVLKLAMDEVARRARLLRGPLAAPSWAAAARADRMRRKWEAWFFTTAPPPGRRAADVAQEGSLVGCRDLFETQRQSSQPQSSQHPSGRRF